MNRSRCGLRMHRGNCLFCLTRQRYQDRTVKLALILIIHQKIIILRKYSEAQCTKLWSQFFSLKQDENGIQSSWECILFLGSGTLLRDQIVKYLRNPTKH